MNILNDPRQPATSTYDEIIDSERRETALEDAYAQGREDQAADDKRLLAWAYSKLVYRSFGNMDDALAMDEIKLILT